MCKIRNRHFPVLERRDNYEAKLPADFWNYLNHAKKLGQEKGLAYLQNGNRQQFEPQISEELEFLWSLGFGNPLAESLLRCIFYYFGSETILSQAPSSFSTRLEYEWGSLSQTSLTQAFILCHNSFHFDLFNLFTRLAIGKDVWHRYCVGALAVALVAKSVRKMSGEVYLPHPHSDTEQKIDLIAFLPNKKIGFCIQIKATFSEQGTNFARNYLHLFYKGVARFNQFHRVDYQPIILDLTLKGPILNPAYSPKDIIEEVKNIFLAYC